MTRCIEKDDNSPYCQSCKHFKEHKKLKDCGAYNATISKGGAHPCVMKKSDIPL